MYTCSTKRVLRQTGNYLKVRVVENSRARLQNKCAYSTFSLPESARPDIGPVPNVVLGKSTEGAINKKAVIVRKTINTSYRFQGHN